MIPGAGFWSWTTAAAVVAGTLGRRPYVLTVTESGNTLGISNPGRALSITAPGAVLTFTD